MDALVEALEDRTVDLAAELVAAYVSHNHVQAAELPRLIAVAHAALTGLGGGERSAPAVAVEPATPAQIKRSIGHDGLVSFIDGKPYKTLKRHLTKHGLTPERYRARYGLPADYPMVCPSYSEQRSALAKHIGLGQPGGLAPAQTEAVADGAADAGPRRRGRKASQA